MHFVRKYYLLEFHSLPAKQRHHLFHLLERNVSIIIAERSDVLRVPNAALRYRPSGFAGPRESDQAQIWVLRDGQPLAIPVVTGLDDDSFTEIVSTDVKAGDQVVTAEQSVTGTAVMPRLRF